MRSNYFYRVFTNGELRFARERLEPNCITDANRATNFNTSFYLNSNWQVVASKSAARTTYTPPPVTIVPTTPLTIEPVYEAFATGTGTQADPLIVPLTAAVKSAALMTLAVVGGFGGEITWTEVEENSILKVSVSKGKVSFEETQTAASTSPYILTVEIRRGGLVIRRQVYVTLIP